MESIKGVVNSLTGYGGQAKEEDVAGNSAAPPQDDVDTSDAKAEDTPSNKEALQEPKNMKTEEGDTESNSRAPEAGGEMAGDVEKDPPVVADKSKGLSGSAADGSHSAVFGLTPDGHKHDDTAHGQGALKPAHSKDVDNTS